MSPADLADLRRQTPKQQNLKTTPTPTCLSLRDNAACCIRLRNLRYLRENNTQEYSSYIAPNETTVSLADPADNRRRNPKTTLYN